jgi:hypothetical protein
MSMVVRCAAARAVRLHRHRLTSSLSLVVRPFSSSSSTLYRAFSPSSIFAFVGAVGGAAAAFTLALAESSSAVVSAEEAAKTAELLYASDPLVREKKKDQVTLLPCYPLATPARRFP